MDPKLVESGCRSGRCSLAAIQGQRLDFPLPWCHACLTIRKNRNFLTTLFGLFLDHLRVFFGIFETIWGPFWRLNIHPYVSPSFSSSLKILTYFDTLVLNQMFNRVNKTHNENPTPLQLIQHSGQSLPSGQHKFLQSGGYY